MGYRICQGSHPPSINKLNVQRLCSELDLWLAKSVYWHLVSSITCASPGCSGWEDSFVLSTLETFFRSWNFLSLLELSEFARYLTRIPWFVKGTGFRSRAHGKCIIWSPIWWQSENRAVIDELYRKQPPPSQDQAQDGCLYGMEVVETCKSVRRQASVLPSSRSVRDFWDPYSGCVGRG